MSDDGWKPRGKWEIALWVIGAIMMWLLAIGPGR